MRRDTWIQLGALGVMLVFLTGAGVLTMGIAASVGRNRLVYADSAEKGDPPEVAAGIAMGAFRGIFVNFLWMRANALKEEGKYYEAVDLSKTITRLQPRFPRVWAFHAWNLAYNISVSTQTPEERWQWVRAGINLMRDQGIPANPNDVLLHKELAWIFLHKVQGYMDDAHKYYKKAMAFEWTIVMGKPPALPLGPHKPEEASKLYIDNWLRPIADAPATIEELYAKVPLAQELVERIRVEAQMELDERFLRQYETYWSVLSSSKSLNLQLSQAVLDEPLFKILTDPRYTNIVRDVKNFARRRTLVETYHMEPEKMIEFTQKFGPLDWRHASAHALYWSALGVERSLARVTKDNKTDFDFVNADRIVIQSVQDLFRTGLVFFDINNPEFYLALPHVDFIDSYGIYREESNERGGVFASKSRSFRTFEAGYENFLRDAIRFLYRRNDKAKAEEYYKLLREGPWLNTNDPMKKSKLSLTLEEFVVREITDDDRETSPPVALQEISGALYAAYVEGLLAGDTGLFDSNMKYARLFHAQYQQTQSFRTWVAGETGRMGFPDFEYYAPQIFSTMIKVARIPQGPMMYRAAPPELQALTYVFLENDPDVKGPLAEQERAGGLSFNAWFPPPMGLDQARARLRTLEEQMQRSSKNTDLK